MDQQSRTVIVRILDKEFRLACRPSAEQDLKAAALYLDKQMRLIRQKGRVIGLERIAIMAGLNIANDLLQLQRAPQTEEPALPEAGLTDRLQTMQRKIDEALTQATTLRKPASRSWDTTPFLGESMLEDEVEETTEKNVALEEA